ncbi:hypothetical protein HNQ07_002071 [Deinococcus metalli]|uniref:Four-helix bundle copper-binding protein n=1 Tax=Deinococcus metalli TaxID=1141878 RepID=A0A7W8KEB7_9DEIO|nr:four-helix bundle copper-binding protein [Deinococcus metalli]MBB5376607.1 hypothetical protein [Deinococcus metalli]GHF42818.1 hypothetical protein GCM10017781_18950 [Deinococcus metalli]
MTHTNRPLPSSIPVVLPAVPDAQAACAAACLDLLAAGQACVDSCLTELAHYPQLAPCIQAVLDCADICAATGRMLARRTWADPSVRRALLEACVVACRACRAECAMHARNLNLDICAACADACARTAQACHALLGEQRA